MAVFSAQDLLQRHQIAYVATKKGKYTTTCPTCGRGYLNVEIKRDAVVWYCQNCKEGNGEKFEQPDRNSGLGPIKAIYDYTDESGRLLFQALRYEPLNAPKQFRLRTGPNQKKWSIDGVRVVPFQLPELIEAVANEQVIFICEGEKDVLRLHSLGIPATCNPMGAEKWWPEFNDILRGADVVITVDNDDPGRKHGRLVAENLAPVAKRVRVLDLAEHWPAIEPSDDISDWFDDAGGTVEQLWSIVEKLPTFDPDGLNKGNCASSAASAVKPNDSALVFDPWAQYIVPPFPVDVLPPAPRNFVRAQSEVIGGDPAGLAMSVLATFSGSLHHGHALRMLRNGIWWASPRLWVVLIGAPSTKKTPIFNAATAPLLQHESRLREKYEHALREYEKAREADDNSVPEPDKPPRYVVYDTTVEKLGEILSYVDGKGILVKSDELAGWLASMERYSNSAGRSDRALWLRAYDGGPHAVDRIKRGEVYIQNLSVSIMGGMQPERLAEIRSGLSTDGLLQRFLPVMLRSPSFPLDRPGFDEEYAVLVRQLIFAKPARLIMDDAALSAMADLRKYLFDLEQVSGGLAAGFDSFVGKLPGVCGSLALILHMAHDPERGSTYAVGESTIRNVHWLVRDFILPHAMEFYRGHEATTGDRLRRIASWILTSGAKRVRAADLTANVHDCRGLDLIEINKRVSPLVACGWLRAADNSPVCKSWLVEPRVHIELAERTKDEERRKGELAALMGSPRRANVVGAGGESTPKDEFKVGDLVNAELNGELVFEAPVKISGLFDHQGEQWATLEGSGSGVKVADLRRPSKGNIMRE